jgi:m7GpppX diphosphatase
MDNLLNDYVTLIGGKKNVNKNSKKNKRETYIRPRYLESYEDYKNNILPEGLTRNKQWIYDIFDGKKEQDRILYQNNDFVLIPDLKWDRKDKWELRVVAFFKDQKLHSMRDLTADDIELLTKVKDISCKVINEKYQLDENQLKIFFHYRPTVWQLHVHFHCLFLKNTSSSIERAHSIYSVIENLKLDTDYFKKVKIHCFNDIE